MIKKIILLLALSFTVTLSQEYNLKIIVKNLEGREGNLSIGLFNNEKGFPEKGFGQAGVDLPIQDSTAEYTFTNLENGIYALAIYNDENCNGELDKSIFGWPTEDYIFSNYAEGSFGPPTFEEASFLLDKDLEIILEF